jgi:hypothetical protein
MSTICSFPGFWPLLFDWAMLHCAPVYRANRLPPLWRKCIVRPMTDD